MKHTVDRKIGERASEFVINRAKERGLSVAQYIKTLGLARASEWNWRVGEAAPSTYALQALALDGADVKWILTGHETAEKAHWEKSDDTYDVWECSCCGNEMCGYADNPIEYGVRYCDSCGKKMQEEE